ncbi:MAG: lectin-like protein [Atopobiaceae bacterium]
MYCTHCGAQIPDGSKFCTSCGAPVDAADEAPASQPSTASDQSDATSVLGTAGQAPYAAADQPPYTNQPQYGAQPMTPQPAPAPQRQSNAPLVACVTVAIVAVALAAVVGLRYFGVLGSPDFLSFLPVQSGTPQSATQSTASTSQGSSIASGSSSTAATVTVPAVTGLSQDQAAQQLQSAGLQVGNVTTQKSDEAAGTVISQSVTGSASKGSSIDLVVAAQKHKVFSVIHKDVTWDQAEQYCESQGGTLACIASADEWNQVTKLADDDGHNVYWIGAKRSGSTWSWVDGSDFQYIHWAAGEPNNEGGQENCAAILYAHDTFNMYDEKNDVSSEYPASYVGFVMQKYE